MRGESLSPFETAPFPAMLTSLVELATTSRT
jgi:hypothetical protein